MTEAIEAIKNQAAGKDFVEGILRLAQQPITTQGDLWMGKLGEYIPKGKAEEFEKYMYLGVIIIDSLPPDSSLRTQITYRQTLTDHGWSERRIVLALNPELVYIAHGLSDFNPRTYFLNMLECAEAMEKTLESYYRL